MALSCSSSSVSTVPSSPSTTTGVATVVPGGCGTTAAHLGGIPPWLDAAGAHNNPTAVPYVISTQQNAAGFLFGHPLRAGAPTNPANKILWVVRVPRNGSSLHIDATQPDAVGADVQVDVGDNSGPGEIYPSYVDVPRAGCWRLDLTWSGNTATFYLVYS